MVRMSYSEHTERKVKYLGSCEVLRRVEANHYACTRLVGSMCRSVLRRMQCSRRREGRAGNRRQSLPPAPVIKKPLSRSPRTKREILKNPSRVQKMPPHPWLTWPTERFGFQRQVVVSYWSKWIPFGGENLSVLREPCQTSKAKGKFKSNSIRWTKLINTIIGVRRAFKVTLVAFLAFLLVS